MIIYINTYEDINIHHRDIFIVTTYLHDKSDKSERTT
jgi:hypothetical protein